MARNLESRVQQLEKKLEPGISRVIVIRTPEEKAALDAGELDTTGALIVHIERIDAGPVYDRPPVSCPVITSGPPETTAPAGDDTPAAPAPERPAACGRAKGNDDFLKGVDRWFQS